MPKTLFEKIWERHVVVEKADSPAIIYIDLHLIHEVTSPQAFQGLRERGLTVRQPGRCLATIDHSIPTVSDGTPRGRLSFADQAGQNQILQLERNCEEYGIRLLGLGSDRQGIVHIIGPELGFTQPGMTIVCGDSHTATHGAFGALAFGIGTSEVGHVLATQCLLQARPRTMEVRLTGQLNPGVSAKDIILAVIGKIGTAGGTGYVIEYTGPVIRRLNMEQRMTICNMSIEAGARAGMISPDEVTFDYLKGRPGAPAGQTWKDALMNWSSLRSDEGAVFDRVVEVDCTALKPMITYGTNPAMVIPVDASIPELDSLPDVIPLDAFRRALDYMGFVPGKVLQGTSVDAVFIGSCTNGRLSDLEDAAQLLKGRKVNAHTRVMVVPGSMAIKKEAEQQGLDKIFMEAGAEWREPGCSMCIAMNGDILHAGQLAVSTSNRNFEGRQGKGSRTLLASPMTAAACAIAGAIADPREFAVQGF